MWLGFSLGFSNGPNKIGQHGFLFWVFFLFAGGMCVGGIAGTIVGAGIAAYRLLNDPRKTDAEV
jgi:hypothetical protein